MAQSFSQVLDWTSTTESNHSLATAWNTQRAVMFAFLRNSWLSKQTDAWLRETEITHSSSGWHVHTNTLLFSETGNLDKLQKSIMPRWIEKAHRQGVNASLAGQNLTLHANVHSRVLYATKGLMTPASRQGHQTLATILAEYQRGDADAAELWWEFAAFFGDGKKRHWRASGGAFRAAKR